MCLALEPKELKLSYRDLIDLTYKENDKGFITLFKKNKKGIMQRHYRKDTIGTAIEGYVSGGWDLDLYTTLNTFVAPQRTIETLRYLNALYIDIDCYKMNMSKESVLFFLEEDLYGVDIPVPTFVVDSGRGLYLIWLIESVPSKALPLWKALQYKFYNVLKQFGADPRALDPARVLRVIGSCNSKSFSNVEVLEYNPYRYTLKELKEEYLPFVEKKVQKEKPRKKRTSCNSKSFSNVEVLEYNPYRYTLKELKEEYLPFVEKKVQKEKPRKKRTIVNIYNPYTLALARIKDLEKLAELRNYNLEGMREIYLFLYRYYISIVVVNIYNPYTLALARIKDLEKLAELRNYNLEGMREIYLFLYRYYISIVEDQETALSKTLHMNNMLALPLRETEVKRDTKSNYIGKYNYSNSKLIEILEITDAEMDEMCTIVSKEKKYEKNNERRKKARRTNGFNYSNSKLIEILEITDAEMDEMCTIVSKEKKYEKNNERRKKARRTNGLTKREIAKREKMIQILKYINLGKQTHEISIKLDISKRTIQLYKKELEENIELREELQKELEKEFENIDKNLDDDINVDKIIFDMCTSSNKNSFMEIAVTTDTGS